MDDLDRYRDKLMEDPAHYVALLRRQNQLHCVWHIELQQRIEKLEAENFQLRAELGLNA